MTRLSFFIPILFLASCGEIVLDFGSGEPGSGSLGGQQLIIAAGTGANGLWNNLSTMLTCPNPDSLAGCVFTFVNQDSMDHQLSTPNFCQSTQLIPASGGIWQCTVQSSYEGSLNSGHVWVSTSGAVKYTQYCASCHGPITQSAKAGANASQIQAAIGSVPSMTNLSTLTSAEVTSIGQILTAVVGGPSGGGPLTGAELYAYHCASCHGNLQQSDVRRKRANSITQAIQNVDEMQAVPALQALTAEQINLIAQALDF